MSSRLGRRSGAAAAIILAALIAIPALPASAAPVTITQPATNAILDTESVVVTGSAEVPPQPLGLPLATLEGVTISVGSRSVDAANCSGKSTCTYRATFTLPLNGPYTAEVVARPSLLGGEPFRGSRSFNVAVPAARPVLDPPKVTQVRTVELSWSRNTEGDMLYYALFRRDPGSTRFLPVTGKVPQPASGAKVTFTDTTTGALDGGAYTYQVVAVRKGPTGTDASEAKSEASGAVSATVPVPLTTSSTTALNIPGAAPAAGGPTTTAARPGAPAGVDLSGFLSSRSQPISLPTITVPELPDTGFSGSLPFGARPPGEELEEGESEAVLPRSGSSSSVISIDAGRPLVPVAGGLVLLLLAMHMRILGRRVKEMPDGDLPVDLPHRPPPLTVAATSAQAPEPRTAVYDVMADGDDEWAPTPEAIEPDPVVDQEPEPVAYEPEPVSVPVPVAFEPAPAPVPVPVTYERAPVHIEPEPVPVPEPIAFEPADIVDLWAPPAPEDEPVADEPDPDEIVVVEVVSSPRRRLVRAGNR